MKKLGSILLVILGVLLFVDLAFVNWKILNSNQSQVVEQQRETNICDRECVEAIIESRLGNVDREQVEQMGSEVVETDGCDRECVSKIVDEKVALIKNELVATPTPTPTETTSQASVVKETHIETVDLSGGSAKGGDWVRIGGSEKWMDTSLYGELVSATWQGWIEVKDGNGVAYARIYDATNNRAVDGSLVSNASGGKASFYSENLSIWRGQNQYYIEVKSSTGYEVTVEGTKIKLEVR